MSGNHSPNDHGEHCGCFDCFLSKQLHRVLQKVTRRTTVAERQRAQRRRQSLQAVHDEMVLWPGRVSCKPTLDYYDNRRPRPEREQG